LVIGKREIKMANISFSVDEQGIVTMWGLGKGYYEVPEGTAVPSGMGSFTFEGGYVIRRSGGGGETYRQLLSPAGSWRAGPGFAHRVVIDSEEITSPRRLRLQALEERIAYKANLIEHIDQEIMGNPEWVARIERVDPNRFERLRYRTLILQQELAGLLEGKKYIESCPDIKVRVGGIIVKSDFSASVVAGNFISRHDPGTYPRVEWCREGEEEWHPAWQDSQWRMSGFGLLHQEAYPVPRGKRAEIRKPDGSLFEGSSGETKIVVSFWEGDNLSHRVILLMEGVTRCWEDTPRWNERSMAVVEKYQTATGVRGRLFIEGPA